MSLLSRCAVGTLATMAMHSAVQAGIVVIEQPVATGAGQIRQCPGCGQSFTAVTDNVESIGVDLLNMNVNNPQQLADRFVTLRFHEGVGGTVLATSTVDVAALIGDRSSGRGLVSFDLGLAPLTSGSVYSFTLQVATERFGYGYGPGDAYAGGSLFSNGGPVPADMRFNVTAVPEPATAALWLAGCGVLAAAARRRSAG
jgi:hypothetical protein